MLAKKSSTRFSNNKRFQNAYKIILLDYGWQIAKEKKHDQVFKIFTRAYNIDPEDQWTINAYGYILRVNSQYGKAIQVLKTGRNKYPENQSIQNNLAWTYWEMADRFFEQKNHPRAYFYYNKAWNTHSKKEINIFTSYLYKLAHLKKFEEADLVIQKAQKNFPHSSRELYKPVYWIFFHHAKYYHDNKKYDKMIQSYKKLYQFSKTHDQVWEKKRKYSHLALSSFNFRMMDLINDICYYWQKFTPEQKSRARHYLKKLEIKMPKDLMFIYYRFYGHILYREGKTQRARRMLDRANLAFKISPAGKNYPVNYLKIPFPLKGYFLAGNNNSKDAITHMGFNQNCYDIYGSDSSGEYVKQKTNRKKLENYFGFGKIIISPVDGEIVGTVSHNPDDPVSDAPETPFSNHVQIKSNGKLYHFVHLKQNSISVKKGDRVIIGQPIARMGNSSSSIPHLHFCVYSEDWFVTYRVDFTNYRMIKKESSRFIKAGRPGGDGGMDLIQVK